MKLYTEEQVRQAYNNGYNDASCNHINDCDEFIAQLDYMSNTIELPSDDEIEEKFDTGSNRLDSKMYESGFRDGVKWMRDKIQGGNK